MADLEKHTILYRDSLGREVRLTCPWGYHTGMIPPPHIWFYVGGAEIGFAYVGDDGAQE